MPVAAERVAHEAKLARRFSFAVKPGVGIGGISGGVGVVPAALVFEVARAEFVIVAGGFHCQFM